MTSLPCSFRRPGRLGPIFRLASRIAIVALCAIASLGVVEAWWLIGSNRELQAARQLQRLGGSVLWAFRLDSMLMVKQKQVGSGAPHWLLPGDSFVAGVYLTNCVKPELDEVLAGLKLCPGIRSLELMGSSLSDAGIAQVGRLHDLELLDLGNTHITDTGLRGLATLTNLKRLNLSGTRITHQGLAALRAELPSATIISDFDLAISAS